MTPEEFQARFMPYAQGVAQRTGLDPRLVLSQAALETGYGRSAPNNNFFGIKSHGQAGGNALMTQEFEGGQMVNKPQSFRGYESPEQSFQGYADFILNNPRYRDVMAQGDLSGQVAAMGQSGYATDPEYANKLASIAQRFGGDVQMSTRGGDTPTAVAADTRSALGFPQRNEGSAMMPPREQPKGLLQALGIQKQGTGGPQGDQPFYQRDKFADLLGGIAVGANTLRANPDQAIPEMVARGQQRRAGNRTAEWLGQQEGGAEFAQMIASGADPAAVLMEYRKSRQPVAPDQTSGMQNYQFLLSQGVDPQTAIERAFGGGETSFTTNVSGPAATDPFTETLAEAEGGQFVKFLEQGPIAQRNIARLDQLEGLLENVETGFGAAAKLRLGEFGIESEGLSDLQAANALINQMVPEQRQPGSGPMSDADLALFKSSVPRLINTAGGNQQIVKTIRQINEYDAELARIAQRAAAGDITRAEARQAVNGMANPLENFNERIEGVTRGGGTTPPPADSQPTRLRFNPETGEFE